ncbi:MAG: ATP-binding cassette domain-containing protein, partial [Puniceicoccales bacterium]|nr:ATP-binding cassette domain-containing protein [Puniceicoccales bacterium]
DVFETVNAVATGEGKTRLRSLLGAFLFRGDDVFKRVAVLSGGERNRLALARLLLRPFNCLILDEPTNHLDMRSKAVLSEAIKHYEGTFIIVSHDRAFLDPLVTKVLEVRDGRIRVFPGNVSYYLDATDSERQARATAATDDGTDKKPDAEDPRERRRRIAERNQRLAPLKKKATALEEQIARLETEVAAWEEQMADPAFFKKGNNTKAAMESYNTAKAAIETAYEQWGRLDEAMKNLE